MSIVIELAKWQIEILKSEQPFRLPTRADMRKISRANILKQKEYNAKQLTGDKLV